MQKSIFISNKPTSSCNILLRWRVNNWLTSFCWHNATARLGNATSVSVCTYICRLVTSLRLCSFTYYINHNQVTTCSSMVFCLRQHVLWSWLRRVCCHRSCVVYILMYIHTNLRILLVFTNVVVTCVACLHILFYICLCWSWSCKWRCQSADCQWIKPICLNGFYELYANWLFYE